jgi:uncharacterized membrane-anchored protein YitT (DUF2179 family)/predicted metal-dependent HD superfamily phosphohydrolase
MQFQKVHDFIIEKLSSGLPHYVTYHNVQHTIDVLADSIYLANKENVTGDDLVLLKTAALFHDTGFLQDHENHEELSCDLARKYLPDYGYNDLQIDRICRIIMTTKLPQSAANDHLSQILCDADLFYLGGSHYKSHSTSLFEEFKNHGIVKSQDDWKLVQIKFLSTHQYFTQTAKKERNAAKQEVLNALNIEVSKSLAKHQKVKSSEVFEEIFMILMGVMLSAFALKSFLVPNHFFDGGITGVALLVNGLYPELLSAFIPGISHDMELSILILVINLPIILFSYFKVGKMFAIKTYSGIFLLAACLVVLPNFDVTHDKLLVAIFGGVFLGIGVGLVIRIGAALDGIEVLALYTIKKTSFTIAEIIFAVNVLIFSVAAINFGIETSLYSILTYFAAVQSIDYVVEGLQAYTGVTIISGKSEAIKYQIVNKMGKAVTVYKGERGFLPGQFEISSECDIIFTVISRLELRKLKIVIADEDPNAFVFANTIKEASGGITSRKKNH